LVLDHGDAHGSRWAAIRSIAEKMGCSAEALRNWGQQTEVDHGNRPGVTTSESQRLKELERENLELRRANEILRKASAFFAAAELDRRPR
jgi:transposase